MTRNLSKLFLALCLLTIGGGTIANAQIDTDSRIQANVPFAFVVGRTTLPAGKYEIKALDDSTASVLEISSMDGRTRVVFETEPAQTQNGEPATKTELVFNKVGDRDFLSQVWAAGNGSGSEVIKSKMEKALEGGSRQHERHSVVAILRHLKR